MKGRWLLNDHDAPHNVVLTACLECHEKLRRYCGSFSGKGINCCEMWKPFFSAVTKRHVERKILQTSPQHLFQIIQDVNAYSQFLPLCTRSKIIKRMESGRQFEATLTVGLPPLFTEEYVSRVSVDTERLTVQAKSIESNLFEALDSKWILKEVESSEELCDVHFEVEMSVSNPVIMNALDQVLEQVAGKQVAAFEKRCREVPKDYYTILKQ